MFRPKYPPQDTAPPATVTVPTAYTPAPVQPSVPASVPVAPASNRPTVQLTPGSALALAAGGGAMVLVVGAVLVSMLLAVAITATSVAVCALVIRSILNAERNR
ncbi:SpdD protein [Streptomyces canus]|uniref:SpdD protein n=1 Tax=Streptomyces canus TaxID=58343 RepID=UPI002E267F2B